MNDLWYPVSTSSGQPFAEFDNVPSPGEHPTAEAGFIWEGFNYFYMVTEGTRSPTDSDPVDAFSLALGAPIDINNQTFAGGYIYFAPESNRSIYGIQYATDYFTKRYYGWVEISSDDANDTLTIHQWALESTANTQILAGEIEGGMIPEPSQFGLILGLFTVASATMRRRKQLT